MFQQRKKNSIFIGVGLPTQLRIGTGQGRSFHCHPSSSVHPSLTPQLPLTTSTSTKSTTTKTTHLDLKISPSPSLSRSPSVPLGLPSPNFEFFPLLWFGQTNGEEATICFPNYILDFLKTNLMISIFII
ncbi:hypothetical protein Scep_012623 [Stephania cephalantha]|uniref:Uncharacterized protein n=1 Tax=Stephania cephalantha TaxID=152367 RepID=A0AAP0JHG5_9MAGN